ncbi:hypothetical protein Tco_0261251 [Tanacetum coccineum]
MNEKETRRDLNDNSRILQAVDEDVIAHGDKAIPNSVMMWKAVIVACFGSVRNVKGYQVCLRVQDGDDWFDCGSVNSKKASSFHELIAFLWLRFHCF